MAGTKGARLGRLASVAIAVFVLAIVLGTSAAAFAQVQIDDNSLFIDLGGKVYGENCDPCHGNISDTDNYASEIIFKHGYHQLVACSSCHTRFPHRPEGTERPTMEGCFNCHGLQHGPMGELATGKCEDCHKTSRERAKPAFHTYDWAKKPHVEPGTKELQTKCMMCHDEAWCVDCHEDYSIEWDPGVPYVYDSNGGCLACHGDENLTKTSAGQPKSYQVQGVDESAHGDLSCQKCHSDYRYEEATDPTPLWNVNAGLACRGCHVAGTGMDEDMLKRSQEAVAEFDKSTHAIALDKWMKGDMKTADPDKAAEQPPTCADCHGGHYIMRTDTAYAQQVLHGSAYRMCARCHEDEYASYDDYYHGAAYKKGASDAPACWDCHEAHYILPSTDEASSVSEKNVAETCGRDGCHGGSGEAFTQNAGDLIHQKVTVAEENPLRQLIEQIRSWFS